MGDSLRLSVVLAATAVLLPAADPYCPGYPSALRTEIEAGINLDRELQTYMRAARVRSAGVAARTHLADSGNFIDRLINQKMAQDGVTPADRSGDAEFLRRVYLDLTGRIPSPAQAEAFLASTDPARREKLVDQLLASPAYVDQFTLFFANRWRVTRAHENISTRARDTFNNFLRQLVAADRPYNEFARDFIQASGEVDSAPGTQFFARWMDVSGPIQDSWDDLTEKITQGFLGYKTECVSCHNGRAHLEKINLHLARRTRLDFWKQSAFLSRMVFVRSSDDPIGFRPRIAIVDRDYGTYSGSVPASNPGNRPARVGAVTTPAFFTTGEQPTNGDWRTNLAWMVTTDRQFARAAANYFWEYFFGHGIVDPADAWDLDRVDPDRPLPGDWASQNANPALLEQLADSFIQNGYHLKPLIRQIVTSETYQLSSKYAGQWKPAYVKYFARHEARRLSAEQIFDAMITATHTEQPMGVEFGTGVVRYANQLPDTTEPFTDGRVIDFLNQLGRGDWLTIDRTSQPTLLGLLFQMNDSNNVNRSLGLSNASVGVANRVHQIDADYADDQAAIRQMFLASLTRYPSDTEMKAVLQYRNGPRYQWLSDLQWALLNKLDFTFNY
jgi:hypothetical protein